MPSRKTNGAPVSFSMTTAPCTCHLPLPIFVIRPNTANPAQRMTTTIAPANAAPMPRRNGDCAGSVSRMTNADSTRCTRNW
jgi:hypothetical protein